MNMRKKRLAEWIAMPAETPLDAAINCALARVFHADGWVAEW